jgi:hypothetical protein
MTFFVNQEVVCIDDAVAGYGKAHPFGITKGQVYTVRWVGMVDHYVFGSYLGLRLVGVHRGADEDVGGDDTPYKASRFRPVTKDPIAVFRAIASDPDGFVPNGPAGPVRVREDEEEAA